MADRSFWCRALRVFAGDLVEVEFVVDGVEWRWRGRLVDVGDPLGPLVDWSGERRRLCRWEALRSVGDVTTARPAAPVQRPR